MILPALTEAKSPFWRPIKYSLFPPLGLATLATYCSPDDEIDLQDEHVEELRLDDRPDLVIIQVYITNAFRAYGIADHYRSIGAFVCLGGLHQVVYPTVGLGEQELKEGYDWACRSFYSWANMVKGSLGHDRLKHIIKHFAYAGGWKKFEPMWNFLIKAQGLNKMLPLLEAILSRLKPGGSKNPDRSLSPFPAIA